MPALETFKWGKSQENRKQVYGICMVDPCLVTHAQSGRAGGWVGEEEAQYGESSPGCCRQTRRPWELLYFHLAARSCTQPRPEQTLGKTTEWKRHHNYPSRIVSTAAIAGNCFPLAALTVIQHYSSDRVRSDIQQREFFIQNVEAIRDHYQTVGRDVVCVVLLSGSLTASFPRSHAVKGLRVCVLLLWHSP